MPRYAHLTQFNATDPMPMTLGAPIRPAAPEPAPCPMLAFERGDHGAPAKPPGVQFNMGDVAMWVDSLGNRVRKEDLIVLETLPSGTVVLYDTGGRRWELPTFALRHVTGGCPSDKQQDHDAEGSGAAIRGVERRQALLMDERIERRTLEA